MDSESEDFDFECEYCGKGGYEDQEGAVIESNSPNGDWSEIIGWCNDRHYKKWFNKRKKERY
jgi:hypothetical protein